MAIEDILDDAPTDGNIALIEDIQGVEIVPFAAITDIQVPKEERPVGKVLAEVVIKLLQL